MDPPLISDPREAKWVAEISEILDRQLEIKVEIPPVSIFKIPETITTKKPEAYKPQQIGFGPYHHFQPGPYSKMQQKKLVLLQRLLQDHKINDFRRAVLNKVEKLVPVIRACYETFLQDDNVSMAWVFAIDGLFLLNLFQTITDCEHPKLDPTKRLLAQDIMMVENQIPFLVLKEINDALHSSSGSNFLPSSSTAIHSPPLQEQIMVDNQTPSFTAIHSLPISWFLESKNFSPSIFRSFSEIHSPLELCSPSHAPTCVEHLLHYMYRSIINNNPISNIPLRPVSRKKPSIMNKINYILSLNCVDMFSVPMADYFTDVTEITNFVNKVPKKEIVQLYEQTITTLHNFSTNKVIISSASILQGRAGFRFQEVDGAVENVYTSEKTIYLPRVTLNSDSEVILRNLVAYETLMPHSDHLPLTEYMGLMCGLIVNVEDVKLLKKENIIKGDLGEAEVVKMFVGMSGSILSLKTQHKSELQEVIAEVKKVYESRPRIRAYLLMKKLASWVLVGLTHIGSFVGATWKIVAFMISIVTVFMLTYQAYCDVYGCDKNNVTMLPYASS